jgi:hypothetical protein
MVFYEEGIAWCSYAHLNLSANLLAFTYLPCLPLKGVDV